MSEELPNMHSESTKLHSTQTTTKGAGALEEHKRPLYLNNTISGEVPSKHSESANLYSTRTTTK